MGYDNGVLNYNIGNCYYELENIGKSILHYERALKSMPQDENLKANLALANLGVLDKITPRSRFILIRIVDGFIRLFPVTMHTLLVMIFYVIAMGFLIVRIISRRGLIRLIGFRMGIATGILFLVLGFSLLVRSIQDKKRIEGVIVAERVDVMSAPGEDGLEVFTLHEGTKVRIDAMPGEWMEIILADGKVGWVKKDVLEII